MGMCTFPVAATLFGLCTFQLIPGMLIVDQCVDFDNWMVLQMNQFSTSAAQARPWLNLTSDINAGSTFAYLALCQGDRPQLFNELNRPAQILADNSVNFTKFVLFL